jgi:hypothetical protein
MEVFVCGLTKQGLARLQPPPEPMQPRAEKKRRKKPAAT